MTFSVHGLPVGRGIAIGRAVLMAGRVDVAHYFIDPSQVDAEVARVREGRNAVM
ncbi:MAG TPA: phosphoenolpyruvate-utilizing N-terminal domain-containing protein, partial [Ramlibacter sp.]|nr:phosphoenolpyruvate-utilizing N-terminal domain-containing protein [Ramlibacter sp.]